MLRWKASGSVSEALVQEWMRSATIAYRARLDHLHLEATVLERTDQLHPEANWRVYAARPATPSASASTKPTGAAGSGPWPIEVGATAVAVIWLPSRVQSARFGTGM